MSCSAGFFTCFSGPWAPGRPPSAPPAAPSACRRRLSRAARAAGSVCASLSASAMIAHRLRGLFGWLRPRCRRPGAARERARSGLRLALLGLDVALPVGAGRRRSSLASSGIGCCPTAGLEAAAGSGRRTSAASAAGSFGERLEPLLLAVDPLLELAVRVAAAPRSAGDRVEDAAAAAPPMPNRTSPPPIRTASSQIGRLHRPAAPSSQVEQHATGKASGPSAAGRSARRRRAAAPGRGQQDAELVEQVHRDRFEDQRERVDRRQQRREHHDHDDRVAAPAAQLLRVRDAELAGSEDPDRDLEGSPIASMIIVMNE